jgi:DNA-binding NarL/FixJ family response regulator
VGLRSLLTNEPNIQITGDAASPDDLENWRGEVDVFVWSPGSNLSLSTLKKGISNLKIGEEASLLLIHDDANVIDKLISLKVHGWGLLPSESSQTELITAVEAVNEGLVVINPLWLQHLAAGQITNIDENADQVTSLTGREIEILGLLALGLTNKQIAFRLGISTHTVKFHVSSIFGKLGTTNRTEAVKLGLINGIISI